MKYLGIDTGGTFTDFVYVDANSIRIHKVLSTPDSPERAIVQGMEEMGVDYTDLIIIHGSTVATNAVLESKGAKTLYIANRGLADVLTIGRQARRELYNLQPEKVEPPVPSEFCLETGGRLASDGSVVEDLSEQEIQSLLEQIEQHQPEAIAINLLFSFIDGRFEKQIADRIGQEYFVSCSHEVMPEYREYERGITTWLNAYVGPLMQGYLQRLEETVQPARLNIMRSSGLRCQAKQAGKEAVHLLLSGPAGGLSGARFVSALSGEDKLLSFDMGGTSTDVAMIDGEIVLANQGRIGHYPVGVPMVDIHTIGAGGGSIAAVDEGGVLHVGPASAGANPGPACYGQGGELATVTDANLILGHLPKTTKLGGSLALDDKKAEQAMSKLMEQAGLSSIEETAKGIIRIANENMSQALRVISVERGIDPREFALVAFGGAGGLHVCALAESLGMSKAIVPVDSGVLSALGMLVAKPGRQLSRTIGRLIKDCDVTEIKSAFSSLEVKGFKALEEEGIDTAVMSSDYALDLCYQGQSSTLTLPWTDLESIEDSFHCLHKQRYGHSLQNPLEIINVRVRVSAMQSEMTLSDVGVVEEKDKMTSRVYGEDEPVSVNSRESLQTDQAIDGPLIIVDAIATVYVQRAWQLKRDRCGNLILKRKR